MHRQVDTDSPRSGVDHVANHASNHALVSVIMPAYNHEDYVSYAIDTVVNQDYPRIELIVVNDGSSDGTHQAIEACEKKCRDRFENYYYRNNSENQGLQKTLNQAISYASGDYLYMIGSDDGFMPGAISAFYEAIQHDERCGLMVGDNILIDDAGQRCFWDEEQNSVYDESSARYRSFGDFLRANRPDVDFLSTDFGSYRSYLKGNYMPGGFFVPRAVMTEIGGYDEGAILDDLNLMLKVSKKYTIRYLDRATYQYRWHSSNTAKQRQHMINLTLNTMLRERDYCKQKPEYRQLWKNYVVSLKLENKTGKLKRSFFKRWYKLTSVWL